MRTSPHFSALIMLVTLFAGPLGVPAKYSDDRHPNASRLEPCDAFLLDTHPPATGGIHEEVPDAYR